MEKKWTKESVRALLEKSDKAVVRGLMRLYEFQSDTEQEREDAIARNKMGFNKPDARVLTNIAKWYESNGFLTPNQIRLVRKKILKYSGQLARLVQQ